MSFTSPIFIFFCGLAILLLHAKPELRFQHFVYTIFNILFIASFTTHLWQIIPLLVFLAWLYLALELIRLNPIGKILFLGIGATLVFFIVLKRYSFITGYLTLPFPYVAVGLSYILFRGLQVMIDTQSGDIKERIHPLIFFNYTCNFLTFVSGPIQRYQDFAASYTKTVEEPSPDTVFFAFSRIVTGYLKVAVIAAAANYLFINFSETMFSSPVPPKRAHGVALYSTLAISYTLYLYYNFSGYMDIVIGLGRLMGQELPENFNHPFQAASFLDFWSRWHMTLSNWFKYYVFNPMMKVLLEKFPSPAATPFLGVFAFFVTFLIMGVWHGSTAVFVLYGLFMGLGASANKLWQVFMTQRLGKKSYKALSGHVLYIYLCRGLTFSYFAVALTCLWRTMPEMAALGKMLGIMGALGGFFSISMLAAVFMFAVDLVSGVLRPMAKMGGAFAGGLAARNLLLAGRILLIIAIGSLFNKAPEFVYKAF